MPPIMGAGAYMMLELVEPAVTYVEIIKAALIPAILYYTALLLTVHFHSKRIGADAESELEPESESPMSAYQGFVFFGAFVILIAMLLTGFTPYRSVSVSLIGILVLSQFSELTRLSFPKVIQALVGAAKGGMALIVAASCVGIILGVVDLTGLGCVLACQDSSLCERQCHFSTAVIDGVYDCSGDGLAFRCLLSPDGNLGRVGVDDVKNAPARCSFVYFLLWNDVDGHSARRLGCLRGGGDCEGRRDEGCVFRFSICLGGVRTSFCFCPETRIADADDQ